jgi:uncharacterized lipoprotein YddW (UPF0748 family)
VPTQQQAEAIAILDRAKALNLNAIVLQVRPSADAIYPSKIEPWSEYLTALQGQAPQPWYDPLKFWVTQAHARGLELHAWFNPYRARHAGARSPFASNHIAAPIPRWSNLRQVPVDGPGRGGGVKQTLDVVLDVVRRYDIDGVHIDDYFYPVPDRSPRRPAPKARRWTARRPRPSWTSRTIRPGSATWPAAASWTAQTGGART